MFIFVIILLWWVLSTIDAIIAGNDITHHYFNMYTMILGIAYKIITHFHKQYKLDNLDESD